MLPIGRRVPPAQLLIDLITSTWGRPAGIVCDRFRLDELRDAKVPCRVDSRVTRWSEASYDIRALRRAAQDGPFSIEQGSRSLLAASLSVALVKSDDAGQRSGWSKNPVNNTARDDVAAAVSPWSLAPFRDPSSGNRKPVRRSTWLSRVSHLSTRNIQLWRFFPCMFTSRYGRLLVWH